MACLGWLVPGLLPLDTQSLLPPRYTPRSNLSPENNSTQSIYMHTQATNISFNQHHTSKEYLKQKSLENKIKVFKILVIKSILL
jgi:hypothetical protein